MPTEALTKLLQRLEADDPERAELAEKLDRRMLELWATAESRLNEPDPRWAEFERRGWSEDPGEIGRLARGTWPERWAAVLNPHTPGPMLATLAVDPVSFIAGVAKARLAIQARPLPRQVLFYTDMHNPGFLFSYHAEQHWIKALREMQLEMKEKQLPMDELLRFIAALPKDWPEAAFTTMLEDEDAPPELAEVEEYTPSLLVRYAHYLRPVTPVDDETGLAFAMVLDLLKQAGARLTLPLHARFSDQELLDWLEWGQGRASDRPELWNDLAYLLPEGHKSIYNADCIPFPGGALLTGLVDGMCFSCEVNTVLQTPGLPKRSCGLSVLQMILAAVWPGHYGITYDLVWDD